METLTCARCRSSREPGDNFCRRCGHQFTVNLPSVRESSLPVSGNRAIPTSLVGSVAVLAVGTGIEWLARRMAGSAARAAGRALVGSGRPSVPASRDDSGDSVTIDEVVYVRRVQLRR